MPIEGIVSGVVTIFTEIVPPPPEDRYFFVNELGEYFINEDDKFFIKTD